MALQLKPQLFGLAKPFTQRSALPFGKAVIGGQINGLITRI
jgi:hypothetical protein